MTDVPRLQVFRGVASLGFVLLYAGGVPAAVSRSTEEGRLEGTVLIGAEFSSRKFHFRLYPSARPSSKVPGSGRSSGGELKNFVVYLETAPSTAAAVERLPDQPLIVQKDETFVPHVLPVLKGTIVAFPNSDPMFHNVFSFSGAESFDLGRYPEGSSKTVRFDVPGTVKVYCHIHSDMSAVVLVLDNPFFTTLDEQGRFRIDGIPPGEYEVVAWHERAKRHTRTVRILPGETSKTEFMIPLKPEPEPVRPWDELRD